MVGDLGMAKERLEAIDLPPALLPQSHGTPRLRHLPETASLPQLSPQVRHPVHSPILSNAPPSPVSLTQALQRQPQGSAGLELCRAEPRMVGTHLGLLSKLESPWASQSVTRHSLCFPSRSQSPRPECEASQGSAFSATSQRGSSLFNWSIDRSPWCDVI